MAKEKSDIRKALDAITLHHLKEVFGLEEDKLKAIIQKPEMEIVDAYAKVREILRNKTNSDN